MKHFFKTALPCLIANKNKTSNAIDLNRSYRLSNKRAFFAIDCCVVCKE